MLGNERVNPSIPDTSAFKLIEEDMLKAVQDRPTYICDVWWEFEWKRNIFQVVASWYTPKICNRCLSGKL